MSNMLGLPETPKIGPLPAREESEGRASTTIGRDVRLKDPNKISQTDSPIKE
jgi:hypothetical protein